MAAARCVRPRRRVSPGPGAHSAAPSRRISIRLVPSAPPVKCRFARARRPTTVTRLRCAVIEPGHFPVEIHAGPFKPQNLARTTGRERKLHDGLHVLRPRLDQSVSLLTPQKSHAPPGFLQHPNLWHPIEPSPILMRDIQYPPNHLECAIDRRVRDTILQLAIANERLQHRHVDRIQLQGPQIRIELLQSSAEISAELLQQLHFTIGALS